jgi:hypothetical protein
MESLYVPMQLRYLSQQVDVVATQGNRILCVHG